MIDGGFSNEAEREAFGMTASGYCRHLLSQGLERETVLNRMVESTKCKNRDNAAAIFCYVQNPPKARHTPRKFVRPKPGDTDLHFPLAPALMERLQKHADRRNVAPKVLAQRMLVLILQDDIVDAVMADYKDDAA